MSITNNPMTEGLEEVVKSQHEVIKEQASRIDKAVDMLEDLVVEQDCDGFAVEKIIQVLMYGEA